MISSFLKACVRKLVAWASDAGQFGTHYTGVEQSREVVTLAPHVLDRLEKQLHYPMLGNEPNDPLFAGQLIGQQRVIRMLRDGIR